MGKLISNFFILIFFGIIILGLHYGIYALLVKIGAFSLKEIIVSGNRYLHNDTIIASSGLIKGTGIFDFSLQEVAVNIGTNSMIEFAEVKRLPPDSVAIKITERKPAGVVTGLNRYFVCDKNGYIILNGYISGFPLIIPDFEIIQNENKINDEYIQLILNKLSEFSDLGMISKVYIKKKEGIYITLKNLDDILFFIGKNITDNGIFYKIFNIANKIRTSNIKVKYIDINKENAIGFR